MSAPDSNHRFFIRTILTFLNRPADMNWTCLVYGGPMFFVIIWWFAGARKWFKGPKVNIEHAMLGREEAVVLGEDAKGPQPDPKDGDASSGDVKGPEKIVTT